MHAPAPEILKRLAADTATAEDRAWLVARLSAYLKSPERGLEHAFRLGRAPGEPPWWRIERRRRRDALIVRMWREGFPDLPAWKASEKILEAQRLYAGAAWRRHRDLIEPPADPVAALLWEAMKLDERFPTSQRRIFEILNAKNRDAFTEVE